MQHARALALTVGAVLAAAGPGLAGCGSQGGGPDAQSGGVVVHCDVVDQKCGAGARCDYLCESTTPALACLPDPGTGAELGQSCRVNNADPGPGSAPVCRRASGCFAASGTATTCYHYCRVDGDCPQGTCALDRQITVSCGGGAIPLPVHLCL
jgi:hypothetical protein